VGRVSEPSEKISIAEVKAAKMKSNKAVSLSGVVSEMLKESWKVGPEWVTDVCNVEAGPEWVTDVCNVEVSPEWVTDVCNVEVSPEWVTDVCNAVGEDGKILEDCGMSWLASDYLQGQGRCFECDSYRGI